MLSVTRPWLAAVWLGIMVVLPGAQARAADTGNGSKNFRTPSTVPNYFSNEAGPLVGGPAESQRGQLYPSQTASLPRQEESIAPPAYRESTRRIAVAHGRTHLASRGPVDRRHVATRSRSHERTAAHRAAAAHTKHAASSRPTHVGSTHKRARG